MKVGTISMLKFHVRTLHMSSVQIQTIAKETKDQKRKTDTREFSSDAIVQTEDEMTSEAFVKYPCGINIANEYHLMEHNIMCCGTLNMYTEPGLPKPPFSSIIMPLPSCHNPYYF